MEPESIYEQKRREEVRARFAQMVAVEAVAPPPKPQLPVESAKRTKKSGPVARRYVPYLRRYLIFDIYAETTPFKCAMLLTDETMEQIEANPVLVRLSGDAAKNYRLELIWKAMEAARSVENTKSWKAASPAERLKFYGREKIFALAYKKKINIGRGDRAQLIKALTPLVKEDDFPLF